MSAKNGHDPLPELELIVAQPPHEDRHEPRFAPEALEVILGMLAAEVKVNTATMSRMDEELANLRADVQSMKKPLECLPEVLDILRTIHART